MIDNIKLILENDLNRETVKRLLEILVEITDNVFNHTNSDKILEITANHIKVLENHYKNIIDSIQKLEE